MTEPSHAVFLSLAGRKGGTKGLTKHSAPRGIEVSFEQSELRGRDVRAQMIRRETEELVKRNGTDRERSE